MNGENEDDFAEVFPEADEEDVPEDFFIDILTGKIEKASPKKLLIQKTLRLLIESYGFDRADLEVNYHPHIEGHGHKRVDIVIFSPGTVHINDNLQRIIVCKIQKKRDKLRSLTEAENDLRDLKELMELLPSVSLGMWTNGEEEFLFHTDHTRFEVRTKPMGVWPVPGERTTDLNQTGGVIQIGADAEDLKESFLRCHKYLNRNLGLNHNDTFKQLAILLLAKIFDETRPPGERRFWIRGEEPFTENGQQTIHERINELIGDALNWQLGLLARDWTLTLEPPETARVTMELARYSLRETQPRYRTDAFRAIASGVMDGREGRYPTPLNVAEMAVQILDPKPNERMLDCSSGTGTFLAMAASHIFERYLTGLGTSPKEASNTQLLEAQEIAAQWAATNALGCDIDPFLVVTSRMNLLFTIGHPGRIFRLDARTFPDGDLDGVDEGRAAIPLGTMDLVLVNPWFSTKDTVSDTSILERYALGHLWERDEEQGFRNTGVLSLGGIPPEVLFLERALQWARPGTGRVGILLPDGLLGNPGEEYVRWWILRHCEVIASVDLPIDPFKVTVKDYGLTPALPSLLILRRRAHEELIHTQHPEYQVFMAVAERAGVDARGKLIFQRAPNGDELVFDEEVVERVRVGGEVQVRRVTRRNRRIHDELPIIAEKFGEFLETGEVRRED